MEGPNSRRARVLKHLKTVILIVGFSAAIAIYVVAGARPENPLGYEPLETKRYIHDLEMYGGKANVLAAEFREWFAGLWYGRNLAFTVAVITAVLASITHLFAVTTESGPVLVKSQPPPSALR
jgi:hypothetical protein